jgi:queuine tRNA-ribosyltransferase
MLDCEVVLTKSGAPAILDRLSGEVMHPIVGPLVEAGEVYLGPSRLAERLEAPPSAERSASPLVLLDAGLGAGTNAILAWKLAEDLVAPQRRLQLISVDDSALAFELAQRPEHANAFGFEGEAGRAASALLLRGTYETPRVDWELRLEDIQLTLSRLGDASVDIVYWDLFSPASLPALWSVSVFRELRRVCRAGATVHTFNASTGVRSALLLAGFAVGEGATTGNARPTTLAALDASELARPLGARFMQRLCRSSAPFPADAPADAFSQVQKMPQFLGFP